MTNLEHISPTIKRKAKELAGKWILCKFCEYENAYISLQDRRWKVVCPQCRSEYYLKEQHNHATTIA